MQLVEKNENVERVYSVYYDGEKLKKLLDEIVKQASYKTNGTFTAPYGVQVDFENNTFISGASLPNGAPVYEKVKSIYRYTSSGPYSYYNDSIAVVGTQVTPPKLACIIEAILSEEPDSINIFLNYANHQELIPIDERIEVLNKSIDEISNFEVDKKITALNSLKSLCEKKNSNQCFDAELLKRYYSQACDLIELQLISEKILKSSGRILLKDYKPSR